MNRNWSLRHLRAKACDKATERDTAKGSASVTWRTRFGDFKIDLDERAVTLRDQALRLTSEEFDVLVFRASHPRSLVTPQSMLARSSTANQLGQTKVLNNVSFPPPEAGRRRSWGALPSDWALGHLPLRSNSLVRI